MLSLSQLAKLPLSRNLRLTQTWKARRVQAAFSLCIVMQEPLAPACEIAQADRVAEMAQHQFSDSMNVAWRPQCVSITSTQEFAIASDLLKRCSLRKEAQASLIGWLHVSMLFRALEL